MGRELQKKKNRSSNAKVRQKPKSKKVIVKGSTVVAANWNQSETLRQNYHRLGLASRLNASTGGVEAGTAKHNDPLAVIPNAQKPTVLIPSLAKVERDANGRILRVVQDPEQVGERPKGKRPNPLGDPLNELESDSDADEDENEKEKEQQKRKKSKATGIVAELEAQARNAAPKQIRHQSQQEREWVSRLVEKYGEDYGKMFRDRRLNPMQQSEGDIRRRIRAWREANERGEGGV